MKNAIALLLYFCVTLTASAGYCLAQSQLKMNADADSRFEIADKELNAVYQTLIKEHKSDPLFLEKLKTAQKAWIAYRNAMLELQYPLATGKNETVVYGSVNPMCKSMVSEEITKQQTKTLSEWLSQNKSEGDVCAGSKLKP